MKAIEIQAPNKAPLSRFLKVFLGGSIEMGRAIEWQKNIIKEFKDDEIMFFNPRRDDWNSKLKQSVDCPEFVEQVDWELKHLKLADIIVMVLDPNTTSPISLLEIGLHANSGNMIVCCPEGFYRKGNIDIVGLTYDFPVVTTIDGIIDYIKKEL